MDYLNRGKEFKYIDVREGRESIDDCNKTNQRYTHHKPTNRQTDKQTNILHLYIIEYKSMFLVRHSLFLVDY